MAFKLRLIKGTRGNTPEDLLRRIENFSKKNKVKVDNLADDACQYMRNYITTHSRREGHTGNLEANITVVRPAKGSRAAVYVGDVDRLNRTAKYWYVLNYGATITGKKFIPPPTAGYFGEGQAPDAGLSFGQRTEAFNYVPSAGGKSYYMEPKDFTPINYIEATNSWLRRRWRQILSKQKI